MDFDDLFDTDIAGDGPAATGLRVAGVPLKYAALSYGTKRANVGYRQSGTDVSNLWAQKGSAVYVTDGGLPPSLSRFVTTSAPGTISSVVSFTFGQNGTVSWSSGGAPPYSGSWAPGGGTVGNAYDVEFTMTSTSGSGTLVGVGGGWLQVNTNRTVSLTVTLPPSGEAFIEGSRVVRIRIRSRSSGSVLVDRSITLTANAERLL